MDGPSVVPIVFVVLRVFVLFVLRLRCSHRSACSTPPLTSASCNSSLEPRE